MSGDEKDDDVGGDTLDDDRYAPSALLTMTGTAEPSRGAGWRGLLAGFDGVTRRAAVDAFLPITVPLEGACAFMYLDQIGLVTTGIGNLADPAALALAMPWRNRDGSPARPSEIKACWDLVKSRYDMRFGGGVAYGKLPGNDLRLDRDGVALVVRWRLEENEVRLASRFPAFPEWPADAQLGVHLMAWALGPSFRFPEFTRDALAGDWQAASGACHIRNAMPSRNDVQRLCFMNAARVVREGLSLDALLTPVPETGGGLIT